MKKQILFVDDEKPMLDALARVLRPQRDVWEITCIDQPEAAWNRLLEQEFDAAVFDVNMPVLSGLELLQRVQKTEQTRDLPVIMLTGMKDRALKRQALDLGATDLLDKPLDPADLVARLRNVLRLKSCQDELRDCNALLEEKVRRRTEELYQSRLEIIWRLAKAAEHRDEETGNHVIRVACISRVVAEALGMDRDLVETLFIAAPLHDIGKIGIPDAILLKRGPLSPGEWSVMKQHCLIGARILDEDSAVRGTFVQWQRGGKGAGGGPLRNPPLEMAARVAMMHHEKWDGTGYPQELAGEEISVEARITAIADVFDALTSDRPYKQAFSVEGALEIIQRSSESHFDPEVCAAFEKALPEVRAIRKHFADGVRVPTTAGEARDEKDLVCR